MTNQANRKPIFALYAHRYAAAGFQVFRLACDSKVPPKGSHGLLEATTDVKQIAEWARTDPYSNIGVCTGVESNVSVADIDPRHGGLESEAALQAEGKHWGNAGVSSTWRNDGGRHIWSAYHPGLVTGQNRLGQGVDVRNDGGYVVAPGSVVNGSKYAWEHWPKEGLPPVQDWMLAHVEAVRRERELALAEKAKDTVSVNWAETSERDRKRFVGLAASSMSRLVNRLAAKRKPGRSNELYTVACFMAPYVRVGAIDEAIVRSAFEDASKRNGLVAENGMPDVRRTMNRAFANSTDRLPDLLKLGDRPYRRAA
jgi:hypothetical protein